MNKTNLWVDICLLIAFLVAMTPELSGIPVHEWLSLALAAAVIIHLLLHWNWIVGVGTHFSKKLWHISRIQYILDILVFFNFVAIILSGLLISRTVLPAIGIDMRAGEGLWRAIHARTADLGVLLIGLHFALNWDWVAHSVKKIVLSPLLRILRLRRSVHQPAPVVEEP